MGIAMATLAGLLLLVLLLQYSKNSGATGERLKKAQGDLDAQKQASAELLKPVTTGETIDNLTRGKF